MPATLEAPARRKPQAEGDFVVFDDVPVFKEHTRRQRDNDGKPLVLEFGREEMKSIAYRCNRRIENTGDYAPVVIRHNDDDNDPEVVGFAGPFRTARKFEDGKQVTYVVAKFRIYRDKADVMRRYPRRSPEVWLNPKKLGDSYFDPISLLGSETPELDLGLLYHKTSNRDGVMRICYQAAMPMATAPAGNNTFVPGTDDDNMAATYEKDGGEAGDNEAAASSGRLSQEDLAQIVDAMRSVCEALVDERMAAYTGSEGDEAIADAALEDTAADAAAPMGDAGGMDAAALGDEVPGEVPPEVAGDAGPPADETPADEPVVDADDDEPVKYEHDCDDDKETKEDDMSTEVLAKYKKENDELQLKYKKSQEDVKKLTKENAELKKKADDAEAEQVKAVRYQKLRDLEAEGFAFDASEEINDVAGLNSEQFDKHVERIQTKYAKIPLRGSQYVKPPIDMTGDGNSLEMRAKYSKAARQRVEKSRAEGKEITFEQALSEVYQENGKALKK